MKIKLLKSIRSSFDIRYFEDKVVLINFKLNTIEEFDNVKEAVSYLISTFCGMEIHQDYMKRQRFRKNLIKYYKPSSNGNRNSKRTQRNVTISQIFGK